MKILAFPFRNEIEILEVKLATLGHLVDQIVIAEGKYTFSGEKRELVFPEFQKNNVIANNLRFKTTYITTGDAMDAAPEINRFGADTAKRWGRDIFLRNLLSRGSNEFNKKQKWVDNDIFILTDADEIPDPKWIASLNGLKHIEHTLMYRHCYYVDYRAPHPRLHEQVCRAFPVSRLKNATVEEMARCQPDSIIGSENKGYGHHFTYQGGARAIQAKLHSFAHGEYDCSPYNVLEYIEEKMMTGEDLFGRAYNNCVKVPDSELPEYLVDNKDRFLHLWSPNE